MKPFGKIYADSYDLFYKKKDYSAECDFLEKIFEEFSDKPVENILDLGCGTGGHLIPLAKRGYSLAGIESSKCMFSIAKVKINTKLKVKLVNKDISGFRLNRKFDAAIAMFSVFNYLLADKIILKFLNQVNFHLKDRGLFIFDIWSAPGVLSVKPANRKKVVINNKKKIIRICQPVLDTRKHLVKIHYTVLHTEGKKMLQKANEVHRLRFFFPEEIKRFLNRGGFKILSYTPFMSLQRKLSDKNWNASIIAKKL